MYLHHRSREALRESAEKGSGLCVLFEWMLRESDDNRVNTASDEDNNSSGEDDASSGETDTRSGEIDTSSRVWIEAGLGREQPRRSGDWAGPWQEENYEKRDLVERELFWVAYGTPWNHKDVFNYGFGRTAYQVSGIRQFAA